MITRTLWGAAAALALLLGACGGDSGNNPALTSEPTPGASAFVTAAPSPTTVPVAPGGAKQLGSSAGTPTTAKVPSFDALPGATTSFGQIDAASYAIEMPDKWNGELVLYAHGFAGFGTEVSVQAPPAALRTYLVTNGFAWAASSYSENGYVPGIGADDTLALKKKFVEDFGAPERSYIAGASMGGNVVSLALENQVGEYDGGLSICGALMGVGQIDYLVSWIAAAEYTSGLSFPIGEPGANLTGLFLQDVPRELGSPANPTEKGKQFASIIKNATGGSRPFFKEGFIEQYTVNFGLALFDPERKFLVNRAATNDGVEYHIDPGLGLTDAQINAGIKRYASDPSARNAEQHPDAVLTTGNISVPLLTLHGTGDLFVPITMEQDYKKAVAASGKSDLLVQRAIRSAGHCKFSEPELTTAFEDLVNWVRDGKKPKGDDISGDLTNAGLQFTNPLRPGDPGGVN
ncbi:MAG: alpha/beta hydrolase [Tepidiformaceae bacterium]